MTLRRGAVATALLGATGCAVSAEPPGMVTMMSPLEAFNDLPFTMTITGTRFRAAYQIDTANGTGAVDAQAFTLTLRSSRDDAALPTVEAMPVSWQDAQHLVAELPAAIPQGAYDVELRDPRGDAIPAGLFKSLGPDGAAPVLTLTSPADEALVGASTQETFLFKADDGPGWLGDMHWWAWTDAETLEEGDCTSPDKVHSAPCAAKVSIPAARRPVDALYIRVAAVDRAQPVANPATQIFTFPFAPQPTVTDGCDTTVGPAAGGTVVSITGTNFRPALAGRKETGTTIAIIDDGGETVLEQQEPSSATLLSTTMLSHPAGPVTLIVRNGMNRATACTFNFLPAPVIRSVTPGDGPSPGGTHIVIAGNHFPSDATVWLVGHVDGALRSFDRVGENRIEGVMPPGTGPIGFVVDAGLAGQSAAFYGFTYDSPVGYDPDPVPCTPTACDPGNAP